MLSWRSKSWLNRFLATCGLQTLAPPFFLGRRLMGFHKQHTSALEHPRHQCHRLQCRRDTHSHCTSVQYSLFTSAERIARAWLKSHGLQCHLCAPENSSATWCCTCLILCRSLTCRLPQANLPHSLCLPPRHKNTQHDRYNMIHSKKNPRQAAPSRITLA